MKRILTALILGFLLLMIAPAAFADEKTPDTRELTMDQAVAMAIKSSNTLKNSQYSIDAAYERRQLASQSAMQGVSLDPETDALALRFMTGLQQADAGWRSSRMSYSMLEDSVTLATHQAYNAVLQAEADLRLAEVDKRNAETQRTVARARYNVGMIQLLEMERAETDVVSATVTLENATKSLDVAYINLNYLLGLWPTDRPVLTDVPVFEKLEVANLNSYIERSLAESPSQWLKNNAINSAKYALDAYVPNQGNSYAVLEISVDQSILDAADSKESSRKALQTLYNTILKLEEQFMTVDQSILVASESLRVTNLRYQTGMATRADVVAAEAALFRAEKSRMDLVCTHDVQKLAFAKPWAQGM